jgi:hypothetical protein
VCSQCAKYTRDDVAQTAGDSLMGQERGVNHVHVHPLEM